MRWILNQINMKQTFIKYLPCARFCTTYTNKQTNKQSKRKRQFLPSWSSQSSWSRQSEIHWQSTGEALGKKGLVLPDECRSGLHRGGDNGAGPQVSRSSRMEGKGGSAFQAEETAHARAESRKHVPRCRRMGSPARLEHKGAHKLKRRISFWFLVSHNDQE